VWIEIQDANGQAIPGFTLADCEPLFGDTLDREMTWKPGFDVSSMQGRPMRLRLVLKDADVYAYRFKSQRHDELPCVWSGWGLADFDKPPGVRGFSGGFDHAGDLECIIEGCGWL